MTDTEALKAIFDVLYLDAKQDGDFYNPDKVWSPETLDAVAEIVRPKFAKLFSGGKESATESSTEHSSASSIPGGSEKPSSGVYLHLFHGRQTPDEHLEDWGANGPCFGPAQFVHETYASDIKMGYGPENEFRELRIVDGCVYYDGMYYGDWAVTRESPEGFELVHFDSRKAEPAKQTISPADNPNAALDLNRDFVAEVANLIERTSGEDGEAYIREVYFTPYTGGCVPENRIGDDISLAIRDKFAWPLRAIGELAARELGFPFFDLECVIDASYEDSTTWLLRDRRNGHELFYSSDKAWRFLFDSRPEFNEFLAYMYKTIHGRLVEGKK